MTRRRTLRLALALLAATGVEVAHATPRRATGVATCCAGRCRRATDGPGRCCAMRTPSADPTVLSASTRVDDPPVAVAFFAPPPARASSARAPVSVTRAGCRGAPLFLLAGSLRL
ncbi:MAG TPA: hypothetical protein VKW76_00985 [Candidatus Binatia bacterium]|nr:hypothetical protein [Candidatus Binatia bacterium]